VAVCTTYGKKNVVERFIKMIRSVMVSFKIYEIINASSHKMLYEDH